MGKKKNKPDRVTKAEETKPTKEGKVKKNYTVSAESTNTSEDDRELLKVQLPADLEEEILDLVQEYKKNQTLQGVVSLRISQKKLMALVSGCGTAWQVMLQLPLRQLQHDLPGGTTTTDLRLQDMYMCLSRAGFKHSQIEQAMNNTVPCGGDLMDALDWLCLNTPNDRLPEGFSQTLCEEENKRRPKFSETEAFQRPSVMPDTLEQSERKPAREKGAIEKEENSMKDWILQYADQDSEEELPEDSGGELDPNERYLELTAKLLDAKTEGRLAKEQMDKDKQKQIGKKIREYSQEMDSLEKHPDFNPSIKISCIDEEKVVPTVSSPQEEESGSAMICEGAQGGGAVSVKSSSSVEDKEGDDIDCSGFAMMEQIASEEKPPEKSTVTEKVMNDIRNFEYTRQQWTGKSPKQFLIDWVRKNMKGSPQPTYHRVNMRGNLHKCRCKVVRKKEGDLEVTPTILTTTMREAEHLASTLALYQLCKGQRVHQLLPPPYRDVWLEWQTEEDQAKEDTKAEQNKPRDQYISKLLSKLKLEDSGQQPDAQRPTTAREEVEESWEDLYDSDNDDAGQESTKPPRQQTMLNGRDMQKIFQSRQTSGPYQELLQVRQQLPVYQHRESIIETICQESVVVVAGETGSGKSTQIPQFILEHYLGQGQADKVNIVCTEPRRISAISLANRVSAEMGEKGPGCKDTFCGYQIRFEAKRCASTRLLYCTTGVLLRKLQQDPTLSDVTHVIVDEVHERSMDSDFLLIILSQLLQKRKDFKVILMSATLDSQKFSAYFNHCHVVDIPGKTFPVEVFHIEDLVERTGYVLDDDSPYAIRYNRLVEEERSQVAVTGKAGDSQKMDLFWTKEDVSKLDKSGLDPAKYSAHTRTTVTRLHPDRINMDIIMELLHFLVQDATFSQVEGAVLIFLPGLADIQELYDTLSSDSEFSTDRYRILALHSVLSSQDQTLAFTVPPQGVRKIVIATNIAETGITIPDVVFVLDCGKVKEIRYMESSQMSALEEVFISKASAKQRQGRAGRVRNGFCFRLFTKDKFKGMRAYSVPEILRVPLEELCLHIMKSELGDPIQFLCQALDPPQPQSVSRAMSVLREVGACEYEAANLTPLGHHLAALPVNVRIGKMLIYGAILGCLEPISVIAAAMSDKSPFVTPLGKREDADAARQALAIANSDHLSLYKAYVGWRAAHSLGPRAEQTYCQKCFLKRSSLVEIQNVSRDLVRLVESIGFQPLSNILKNLKLGKKKQKSSQSSGVLNISQSDSGNPEDQLSPACVAVLKAVLTAGLYPHVAKTWYEPPVDSAANPTKDVCMGQTPQGVAQVHPSSVNRFLGAKGWLVYHEKVRHTRVYLRDSTLVGCYPILLFGGSITVQHHTNIATVDDWIKFKAVAKTAVIFKELRTLLDDLLRRKLENPELNLEGDNVVGILLKILCSER